MELLNNIDSLIKAFESDDLKEQKGAVHYLRHDVIQESGVIKNGKIKND